MRIRIGYTPSADDAYMLYGLFPGGAAGDEYAFEPVEANLQTLNDHASRGEMEITMISAASYALIRERYALLPCGSSFGIGCGPLIVAREAIPPDEIANVHIAIPGATTTAYAMLQLYQPTLRTRILPFDKLLPAVEAGLVDCALVIHEEFVTYRQLGLSVVVDLSEWWADRSGGMPMPVTCCVVRKDLPAEHQCRLAGVLAEAIRFSRDHHGEALRHAMKYSHGAEPAAVEQFVRQYVNDLSVDMGHTGRKSLETFFEQTARSGFLPNALPLEFVGGDL